MTNIIRRSRAVGAGNRMASAIITNPLVKPTGAPIMTSNSLGIIFWMFDTGLGYYAIAQDCAPSHGTDPSYSWVQASPNYAPGTPPYDSKQSIISSGDTGYGTAFKWTGLSGDVSPGCGVMVGTNTGPGTGLLRSFCDLKNAANGAAFTMFATYIQTGSNVAPAGGFICGRSQDLDNDHEICTIKHSTGGRIQFGWSAVPSSSSPGWPSPQFLNGATSWPMNVPHTVVVTCYNTSAGVSTIEMYVDGVLDNSISGQTICDIPNDGDCNDESQMMTGTSFHVWAGQSFSTMLGSVFQWGVSNQRWHQSDASAFSANPYQYLAFTPIEVLLVAGQSNATGNGLLASDLPSYLVPSDPRIQIWNGSAFVALVNGSNNAVLCLNGTSSQNWGPEAEFSYDYRQANPGRTLYIVKFAVGGAQLAVNNSGTDWNSASTGKLFDQMTTYVANALATLSGPVVVRWLIWMQGEEDSLDSTNAANYGTNLAALQTAVKIHWGSQLTKMLVGRISDSTAWTFRASVRSAESGIYVGTGPDNWVNTDSYPRQADNEHYTAAGQISFGDDLWSIR